MIFVKFTNGLPTAVAFESCPLPWRGTDYQCRHDWESFEQVQELARRITALTGDSFVGTDDGVCVSPRYDIIKMPKIGDKVSYGFNGDFYPDGEVIRITKNLMITTSTGNTYRRRGLTGRWVQPGGTWTLVQGHHDERNPHF